MLKIIKEIILFIWQLPQNILGLFFWIIYRDSRIKWNYSHVVYLWTLKQGSISLGKFIFINLYSYNEYTIQHEVGHSLQSLILGPIYLLVIVLPSILWATYYTIVRPSVSYYDFWTEAWAERLGGNR